jgi:4-hydroxybenzoate polyprenyltransferase
VNVIRNIARFFVFRNVWIALCAVSMLEETRWFFGEPVEVDALAIFIFFSTFFEYNLHTFSGKFSPWKPLNIVQHLFSSEVKKVLRACIVIGFAGSLASLFFLELKVLMAIGLLAIFTIGYSLPLMKKQGKFIRLREITYLKIFTVAFVWSFVTVIVPMLEFSQTVSFTEIFIIFIRRFLFIYAITIPFEIRDMEREKLFGNISLPMIYGVKTIKVIGIVFIIVFILLCGLHEKYFAFVLDERNNIFLPLALSGVAAGFLIVYASSERPNWYFKFWTDGTMILQFILLILFNQ